ncbi:hypothetical protein AC579_4612 [Pseudocercospora musae]|uniref:Uncharacterized protein n=1 Tax=Pseudocercospora musae TaxID=113226 RepID=A0A139H2E8_9PEZI|nr:hypothetical protein AC579_4612 [Pseudocercospora musae]
MEMFGWRCLRILMPSCQAAIPRSRALACFNRARRIQLDLAELGKAAAAAVRSESCIRTETLTQGMHNKAVLLTVDDGKQVVAKLP